MLGTQASRLLPSSPCIAETSIQSIPTRTKPKRAKRMANSPTRHSSRRRKSLRFPLSQTSSVQEILMLMDILDVVMAARGGNHLYWMAGEGHGGFGSTKVIELPGRVTAMT